MSFESSAPRLTLLESHNSVLSDHLDVPDGGNERAAVVLFRRLGYEVEGLSKSDRFRSVEVMPIPEEWIIDSSASNIRVNTAHFREIYRRCQSEGLVFGFAHSHSSSCTQFSGTDDVNEMSLHSAIRNRNGQNASFVALLRVDRQWKARVRYGDNSSNAIETRHICTLSSTIDIDGLKSTSPPQEHQFRQEAAFGGQFVQKMRSLRVGVIGCSGTGSPIAIQLARSGVAELILIDPKKLNQPNLNRVCGSKLADVGKYKAELLREYILSLGLETNIAIFNCNFDDSPDAIDAIATCDFVFGCSDDNIGRQALNQIVYSESLALIDTGLGGVISEDALGYRLRNHHARISTILPESGQCLRCQGVVLDEAVRHEYALRDNPDLSEEEANEQYLRGGNEQAPGVGPFTNQAAGLAVSTLYNLLRSFRKLPPELRSDLFTIDFIGLRFSSPALSDNSSCEFCGTRTVNKNLSQYRLGQPMLGETSEYC